MRETYLIEMVRPKRVTVRELEHHIKDRVKLNDTPIRVRRATPTEIHKLTVTCPLCMGEQHLPVHSQSIPEYQTFKPCPLCKASGKARIDAVLDALRNINPGVLERLLS